METIKKLYRSKTDRIIFGVCGGLGKYFNIDPLIIRLIFVALLFSGAGFFIYFIFVILVPSEDSKSNINLETGEIMKTTNINDWRFIFGIILVIIGISILISNCFPDRILWFRSIWRNFWPIVLILLGGVILFKRK
ncbi:MAG TPA: PspC domain-containing protein [bacterium]|nr:PspC domain-containing protein [bacterium]